MTRTTTTVKKSSGTTTRRKRTVKSRIVPVETVTKYTKPTRIEKVTETPSPTRPEKPNLTWKDYRDDIQVRFQIHSYEWNEMMKDLKTFVDLSVPYVQKAIEFSKETYESLTKKDEVVTPQ